MRGIKLMARHAKTTANAAHAQRAQCSPQPPQFHPKRTRQPRVHILPGVGNVSERGEQQAAAWIKGGKTGPQG